jgi:arylsulfatase A-like enzyme
MEMSRREFMQRFSALSAAAWLGGVAGIGPVVGRSGQAGEVEGTRSHPNILLILVDQMRTPPEGYGPDEGMAQGLKEILGFRPLSPANAYTRFFPGLLRLRQNAVVLRKHYTASAACVPSRACIMTGQYPGITGVTQTDQLFKTRADVPWLDPNGIPTIGDWFQAAGYTTHYFGKWHVSDAEPPYYLRPWGFSDWSSSYPEPHGGGPDNFAVYRDVGFADNIALFLSQKGKDRAGKPWLAVGSLVNPHDNGTYPTPWQLPPDKGTGIVRWVDFPPPPGIPSVGEKSFRGTLPNGETLVVDLNPDGFPQDNGALPPTFNESLDDKPRCQQDYSLKFGFATKGSLEYDGVPTPEPLQLQGDQATAWSLAYNQFYAYCHYLMDLQLRRILQALDGNGLTENTVVAFLADHGEMGAAHGGMIQKWHNAYEEAIRVPMIISSPLVNPNQEAMREILQPTSSIDVAPTLLALAGYTETELRGTMEALHGKTVVKAFVGADLSSHIKGESMEDIRGPDGEPRPGVFFITSDMISELGPHASDDMIGQYNLFLDYVDASISAGSSLVPGTVRQPNNVLALCTGDWKIVRYVDPHRVEPDEWELYCLTADPIEQNNLVDFRTGEVRCDVTVPGLTREELILKNQQLKEELTRQEARTG